MAATRQRDDRGNTERGGGARGALAAVMLAVAMPTLAVPSDGPMLSSRALAPPPRLPLEGRAPPAGGARSELPEPVRAALVKHKLPLDSLSIYVQDVTASAPVLSYKAQIPRNPASVMKLVTTLVALHELGPAYRFHTDAYADAAPSGGRLEGNLYIKGGGDPFLVTESFWRFLKDLRQRGVEHITGDLVIDSSYFDIEPEYRGDFDGRAYRAYNVGPDATLVNFYATQFKFFADPAAERVRVVADPDMATLQVHNELRLTADRCSWRNRRIQMSVESTGPAPAVRFTGTFPRSCGEYQLLRAVADRVPYVHGVFAAMWAEMGGRIEGGGRAGSVPDAAVRLHRARSRPLADLIRYMNKYSNNVMTRNLMLALGAATYGAPGTLEKGRRAVADWMLLNDIRAPELAVDNGAGLSRKAQISALSLARVLLRSWRSSFMPEFVSSLPLSALDGTLRKRFRKSDLEGQVHMKTGLLNGVRSIAGYMQTDDGRTLVVVSLQNHGGVQNGSGTAVQDALLEWLYDHGAH